MTPFGRRRRELRSARGLKFKDMAAALGVSAAYFGTTRVIDTGWARKGPVQINCPPQPLPHVPHARVSIASSDTINGAPMLCGINAKLRGQALDCRIPFLWRKLWAQIRDLGQKGSRG